MKKMLITGGCGFIGCHAARYFADKGWNISVLDNLSRKGSELNLAYLQDTIRFNFVQGDIRSSETIERWLRDSGHVDAVLHMASQVAVTTSVREPRLDFDVNALGTFNLLEAMRAYAPQAALLYASTNKVYGGLEHRPVALDGDWYNFVDLPGGVSEEEPLDFHSPYGCSKGAADQYVRDYARIYGLRTSVIRQSCIYGTRQFGVEDQGWLAWFAIAAFSNRPLTIFGDGKQVRDALWIEDLLRLYELCIEQAPSGAIYNAGGGSDKRTSLLGLINLLQDILGRPVQYAFSDWRPGDQQVFYSDNSKAERELGWHPQIGLSEGVRQLVGWISDNQDAIWKLAASS
jgi:CDP-paratose 2-epimerase